MEAQIIKKAARKKKITAFIKCPEYETEQFYIRKMQQNDKEDLFACYNDKAAAKFFNGDCCGDDFYYTERKEFQACMEYWESRYKEQDFVRFSIEDKARKKVIGMIELCPSLKYSADQNWIGILRIDLISSYENHEVLKELMSIIVHHFYRDFGVQALLMKAQSYAYTRRAILKEYCFVSAQDECSIPYMDYFIRF